MGITLTQFVAADDGEYTMTDEIAIGSAIKLDDRTRAVSLEGEGFRWGVVKSKGAALADDAAAGSVAACAVDMAQGNGERWLRVDSLAKEAKLGKLSKK